mgnify:CR=1 FL=1
MGISAGTLEQKFDGSKVEAEESTDAAFPSSEVDGTGLDLTAGVHYAHRLFYAGLSVMHLTAPTIELGETHEIKVDPTYYFSGGGNIQLNNPLLSIQPSMQVMTDLQAWRADVTIRGTYTYDEKRYYAGGANGVRGWAVRGLGPGRYVSRNGTIDYINQSGDIKLDLSLEYRMHMFWKLDKLQTVILPKNVTKIDDNAFYDCLNIETIVVGDATTVIGNDAFGACKNLKNLVFLCRQKPTLDSDAFTDPISDQPYQVEKMYVPTGLYQNYVTDTEYTSHAKEVCTNFTDDEVFRAYGSRAVMSTDQLQGVTDVDGWFDYHTGVKDLTSLRWMGAEQTLLTPSLSMVLILVTKMLKL